MLQVPDVGSLMERSRKTATISSAGRSRIGVRNVKDRRNIDCMNAEGWRNVRHQLEDEVRKFEKIARDDDRNWL